MAPRKPKPESAPKAQPTLARVPKSKAVKSDKQPRSYRMKRYRNGLLNLEQTPAHLVSVVQANAKSHLLRLPAELRNKIWDYACGGQSIMLPVEWNRAKRGGAVDFPKKEDGRGRHVFPWTAIRKPSAFHLPEICRQVYAETALTSYKANAFICEMTILSQTQPMRRLMAAQRRAVTTLEPMPLALYCMTMCADTALENILRVWPGIRTVVITPEAMQEVRDSWCRYGSQIAEMSAWNEEQWCVWLMGQLNGWKEAGVDFVFKT